MWKNKVQENRIPNCDYQVDDFKTLLRYINHLASHKLGYPVSLLTYLGIVNNNVLGIKPGSIANILLNNVGDPFKDSETSLLEVKRHEREVINILEKFYGLEKNEARGYVTTGGTEGNFAGLWWSKRYLINRGLDILISYDDKIKLLAKEEQDLTAELAKIALNDYRNRAAQLQKILDIKNQITEFKNVVQQLTTPTVFYTKGSTHYSIPKISEILHLNIRAVAPDANGGMDMQSFQKEILLHIGAHPFSPIVVIANIGTTITGAIDNVPEIKKILEKAKPNLIYTIHMDGALTGFVLPILKPFGDIKNYFTAIGVNTLAVSAHKYPGLSQPCGIIIAQRDFFQIAFAKSERSIDYVGNILDVTISGSRSGLNVLMFYHALTSLDLNKNNNKLTEMVNENMRNAKYLYDELVKIYGVANVRYPHHFNVMFPKPSEYISKKYQLMITGNIATIVVLSNVNKKLIGEFIKELNADKEMAMKTDKKTNYNVVTLESEHVKSTIDLFIKTFCNYEPITKHLHITADEYEPYARDMVQKAVKDGLSKVAIDDNHKVIAFHIAEDLANPFHPVVSKYPKLAPIIALIDQLANPFVQGKVFHKGKIIHAMIAAVDVNYQGHGLSTVIDMAAIESAARKGFEFAYTEFTNEKSEKVAKHFRLSKEFNSIAFATFEYQGKKPFVGLNGRAVSYIAALHPDLTLDQISDDYTLDITGKTKTTEKNK